MHKAGVLAFGITTALLVPATIHVLSAGPAQIQKLVAPDASTIHVGAAKVHVAADRAIIDAGGTVHVTLTAASEKDETVKLAIVVLESRGSDGGRVELPPKVIANDTVALAVKDGKAEHTLAYALRGYRGDEMDGGDAYGHYTIFVMQPKTAAALDKMRKRAAAVDDPMEDAKGTYGAFEEAYYDLGKDGSTLGGPDQVARIDVNTLSPERAVSIVAEDTATVGDDIAVTVRVKNPTKYALDEVVVALQPGQGELEGHYAGLPEDAATVDDNPNSTIAMKAHETRDVVFHVHATAAGTLGLYATARCDSDACATHHVDEKLTDGSLGAIDILPSQPRVAIQ
jgi:hypothetical protein